MRGAMPLPSPASCAVRGAARPCLRRAVCPFASALQTSPYREARGCPRHAAQARARAPGLVRQGDKWLRAPARGQRGAGGKASDAQVGGIIKALEQQKSPPPPEWWVRKREEWLQKQRVAAAKKALTKHLIRINPDFTGTPMDAKRDALYARGPALSGLRSIPSHKEQRGAHGRHAAPKRRSARAAAPAHAHASPDIVILPGKHLVHPHR